MVEGGSAGKPLVPDPLREMLVREEGYRAFPYDDATGRHPLVKGNVTIGIGHNLTQNGLPAAIIEALYAYDVAEAERGLDQYASWWRKLDAVRQRVLVSMAFNLGIQTLRTFREFLNLLSAGSYTAAAADLRGTVYARQLPARVERLAKMLETGRDA